MKKYKKIDPIPVLECTKKPNPNCNDGFYKVSIPLKYIIKACESPAAYFEFQFIGLKGEWK